MIKHLQEVPIHWRRQALCAIPAWIEKLRVFPLKIFNRLKIFIIGINFAETLILHTVEELPGCL